MRLVVCALLSIIIAFTGAPASADDNADILRALTGWFSPHVSETQHDGQYIRPANGCSPADPALFPDWKGFPVERCDYTDPEFPKIPVTTVAYAIFPEADELARWILNACLDNNVSDTRECAGELASHIWYASNAMFPVGGYVVEPAQEATWDYPNEPYCMLFRDGVTVNTDSYPGTTHAINNMCGPDVANTEPVRKAFLYARIGSTTRSEYRAATGKKDVGTDGLLSPEWSSVAGALFREALSDPQHRNLLLEAVVPALGQCDGNILTGDLPCRVKKKSKDR